MRLHPAGTDVVVEVTADEQEYQACVIDAGGVEAQVPMLPVSTLPTVDVPVIVGGAEFQGAPKTSRVETELIDRFPAEFVAVTRTTMKLPTSAATKL